MSNELNKIQQNIKNKENEKAQEAYEKEMRKHRYYYNHSNRVDEYMPKIMAMALREFEKFPHNDIRIIATDSVIIKERIVKYLDSIGIDYTVKRGYIKSVSNGDGYPNDTHTEIYCDHCFYLNSLNINKAKYNKEVFIKFNNTLRVTYYDSSKSHPIYFERYCDEYVPDSGSWGFLTIMAILILVIIGSIVNQ
tara:strand:+ start:3528 stop:4106 length:579 start_codon:yes stop_codon:yes gene_type:complete